MRQPRVSFGLVIVVGAAVCGASLVASAAELVRSPVPVAVKKFPAEEGHKNRAAKLRESGLTLLDAIKKAEPAGGGPALFVSANAGKKDSDFVIQVECFAGGGLKFVRVTKGEVKKMPDDKHSKYEIADPAAAAEAMKKFTLADGIRLAVKEKPGDPIVAQAYTSGGKVLIEVRMVDGDDLWAVDIDPATGKITE
jgi:hypothetical protein